MSYYPHKDKTAEEETIIISLFTSLVNARYKDHPIYTIWKKELFPILQSRVIEVYDLDKKGDALVKPKSKIQKFRSIKEVQTFLQRIEHANNTKG